MHPNLTPFCLKFLCVVRLNPTVWGQNVSKNMEISNRIMHLRIWDFGIRIYFNRMLLNQHVRIDLHISLNDLFIQFE